MKEGLLSKVSNFTKQHRKATLAAMVLVVLVIIIVIIRAVISSANYNSDNFELDESQNGLQVSVQEQSGQDNLRYVETIIEDGAWKLSNFNSTEARTTFQKIITNNDEVVLGPSYNFTIDELINNSVPNVIIDYLYPDKPQWVNINEVSSHYPYSLDEVKGVIQSFAVRQGIDLSRVTITSELSYGSNNSNVYTEYAEFKFRLNSDSTEYIFYDYYTSDGYKETYQILDNNRNVLYESTTDV